MAIDRIEELWAGVLDRWTDDSAHTAFIEYCRSTERLGDAAARYRKEADNPSPEYRSPGRTEIAKKRLFALTTLAMVELDGRRTTMGPVHHVLSRLRWPARAMLAFLIVGLIIAATRL